MTPSSPVTCQHELRPGTKVCLHCRRAEREAREARHRAVLTRIGLTGAAIAACAYAGVAGYRAWQGQGSPSLRSFLASPASLEAAPVPALAAPAALAEPVAPVAQTVSLVADSAATTPVALTIHDSTQATDAPGVVPAALGTSVAPASAPSESLAAPVAPAPATPAPAPVVTTPPAPVPVPPLQPVVAEGRTELQNGIYALRRGDTVTVHFDTPEARTRRADKFELIVRATLPAVHGAAAESILATIAAGNLVAPGATITEPQGTGISLRGRDGKALSVVPQTRPGRDGPLVIAYRVTPAR